MAAWGSTHGKSKSFSLSEIMKDEVASSTRNQKTDGPNKPRMKPPMHGNVVGAGAAVVPSTLNGPVPGSVGYSSAECVVEQFKRDGFLLVPDVLNESECSILRNLIDKLDEQRGKPKGGKGGKGGGKGFRQSQNDGSRHNVHKTLFEHSPNECFDIFKNRKILPIVKELLSMAGSSRENDRSLLAHVIHNNAFKVNPGGFGQASKWHTDDPPLFTGELPPNVHIAPMVLTCMYYLNDIREGNIDGMTHVIPGSHRLGRPCTEAEAENMNHYCPAVSKGSVMIISSAVWHKGCPVAVNGNARYLFQVSYGRRLVGHKFKSIMDYHLPPKMKSLLVTDEDKELMGYLQGGAYS